MIDINYKLYKPVNKGLTALQQILYNRGIPVEDQQEWLDAGWDDINHWSLLDNMREAAEKVHSAIKKNQTICVLMDCDCDGITSSSIAINYLSEIYPEWTEQHLGFVFHEGKQHGLADTVGEILEEVFGDKTEGLVLIPDAATNDAVYCKQLVDHGLDVVVLDHHNKDTDNSYATIVNPQMDNYPNKNLVGAGVTWQFCRAYDEIYGYDCADNYIDLCAVGQIGDMSDYRDKEVRAIVNVGQNNIRNPFLRGMIKKNEYSINKMNGINYYSIAFYLVPYINAITRSATVEEKEMVYKSFLTMTAFDEVPSSKRGHTEEMVKRWEEAITIADRVKRRQTKVQDEALAYFSDKIEQELLDDNAMVFLVDEDEQVPPTVRGLLANKIQAKAQRPTAVLTLSEDGKELSGSIRNYSLSVNQDLKATLESTSVDVTVQGHSNAAGCLLKTAQLPQLKAELNEIYKDVDQTPTYHVDYDWNIHQIDENKILQIGAMDIYGQNIPESLICIHDIPLDDCKVTLMGLEKGHPTLKIQVGNVSIIKFKSSEEEYEAFLQPSCTLTVIGKCQVNEWNGNVSPQVICEDYDLEEEWVF